MKIIELKERKLGLYKTEPHYNTAEFTASVQHYKEFGVYTKYPVNTSPTSQWHKFWVEEARRCLRGYNIGRDEITGYHYWYLNYCPIEIAIATEEETSLSDDINPEYLLNYNEKIPDNKDIIVTPDNYDYGSIQSDRVTDFPDFWDSDYDYYWYLEEAEQSGEHAVVLKTRGRGYSFKGGSMMDRNFYLIPRAKSYAFAAEKEYLISDGILTKAWDMMGHIETHTPWGKRKSKIDTLTHKRASYMKISHGIQSELGFGSEIIGVTFRNNVDKGRGKRGKLILWEEAGKFPNLLQSWNISLKSMAQGRLTFGLMVAFGTGGTGIDDLLGLEQLYTRGGGYRVHMIPNRTEPELGYDTVGYFVGEQSNHEVAIDKDGNSHKDKALEFIMEDRKMHLEKTRSREMHLRYCAEACIKPSEALMQIGNNIFPVDLLKQQRAYLLSHKETILSGAWIGSLFMDPETQKVEWKFDPDAIPIDHYPHNDISNINGAVVIFEPPILGKDGLVPPGVYISGNDNYDHDQATTSSLGSTFIMSKITERIVAEYTGRPSVSSIFYDTNYLLLKMYNARQNFENNLQGLRNSARKNHWDHMLIDTPEYIKDKIDDKRVLLRGKGTPGTAPIKKWGRELILEWLLRKPDPASDLFNLNFIKSIPLLDELIYFNDNGNFDRVDALIYLMIYLDEIWHFRPTYDEIKTPDLPKFFSENPLFKQNTKNNKNNIMPKITMGY